MANRVLILANGDPPLPERAQAWAREADWLLATDGAARKAGALGVTPHALCGDFDSVDLDAARADFPNMEIVATPDQEFADLEKALRLARARGGYQISLMGALGGRVDHTLSSFALLQRYNGECDLRLLDNASATWALAGRDGCVFETHSGETVSLITFTGAVVSIQGTRWPLDRFALRPGTHGVSNVADGPQVTVTLETGSVFVTHFTPTPRAFL